MRTTLAILLASIHVAMAQTASPTLQPIPVDWVLWPTTSPDSPTFLGVSGVTTDTSNNGSHGWFLATSNAPPPLPFPLKFKNGTTTLDTNQNCFANNRNLGMQYNTYTFPKAVSNFSACVMVSPGEGENFHDLIYWAGPQNTMVVQSGNNGSDPNASAAFNPHGTQPSTTVGGIIYYTNNGLAGAPGYMLSMQYLASPSNSQSQFEISLWNAKTWQQVGTYQSVTNTASMVNILYFGGVGHGGTSSSTDYWGALCISTNVYPRAYGVPYLPTNNIPTNYLAPSTPWFGVGVPGGQVYRSTIYTNLTPSGGDDCPQINTAIAACPSNQVVLLSAGTWQVHTNITMKSFVTLRGAGGPTSGSQSVLNLLSASDAFGVIVGNNGPASATYIGITNGALFGATNFMLSNTVGVAVGTLLTISETNNPDFVFTNGDGGLCNFCDSYGGSRAAGQTVQVTNISGRTVSFWPPLCQNYTNAPIAQPFSVAISNAGLEWLTIQGNNSGYTDNILMKGAVGCWAMSNILSWADGDFVEMAYSLGNECSWNYTHDPWDHTSVHDGTDGTGFFLNRKSTWNLIANNTGFRMHVMVMLNWGPALNVIAYNFSTNIYSSDGPNYVQDDFQEHGAHPHYNLWEGNAGKIRLDSTHGGGSDDTIFRNILPGITLNYLPNTNNVPLNTPIQTNNTYYPFQAGRALELCTLHKYNNVLANVIGSWWVLQASNSGTYYSLAPTVRSYNNAYEMNFGYANTCDNTGPANCPGASPLESQYPFTNAVIAGNWDAMNASQQWLQPNTNINIPTLYLPSLFLTNKPTWWSGNWPGVDPATAPGNQVTNLPAYQVFQSLGLPASAASTPPPTFFKIYGGGRMGVGSH